MKSLRVASVLLTTIAFSSAFAASSGTLLLQGTVSSVNDIVVTPNTANNTSLNIVDGETGKNVASVLETSNNLAGYSISISSATGGELRHTVDASKKTTYKISYDGNTSVTPSISGTTVKNVSSLSGLTNDTSDVAVDVDAFATAPAGVYSDTLTISIVAN